MSGNQLPADGHHTDFWANKPSDVISTLVSIYDLKDLFVKKLQVLLAQWLLAIKDGNLEKEVFILTSSKHCIDLISPHLHRDVILRFWRSILGKQHCKFAKLWDMADLKRIDQHMQAQQVVCTGHFLFIYVNWLSESFSQLCIQPSYPTTFGQHWSPERCDDFSWWECCLILFVIGVWALDTLILCIGSVDKSSILKALGTWVDVERI